MKTTLPCCAVRDLLPLYAEGLTSDETSAALKQHFEGCANCADVYKKMTEIKESMPEEKAEVDYLKNIRRSRKRWIVFAICATLLTCIGLTLLSAHFTKKMIARINDYSQSDYTVSEVNAKEQFEDAASEIFPAFFSGGMELGSPENVVLHSNHVTDHFFFDRRSYTLLCKYDAAEYEREKTALETRYTFRTELLDTKHPSFQNKEVRQIEPYAVIGDDEFRFLLPTDNSDDYFKNCLLVVTNDVEHEIGYLVFRDIDLDYAEDLTEFLNNECGWKNIR